MAETETTLPKETAPSPPDVSKSPLVVYTTMALAVLGALGGLFGWGYGEYKARLKAEEDRAKVQEEKVAIARGENERLLRELLIPIQTKLKLNLATFKILKDQYRVERWGILESYYQNASQDGPKKHALQFGYITDLVKQDSDIILLLEQYAPHRITSEFSRESELFLSHAQSYVVRFRALPTLVESGGSLPRAQPFPDGFPGALDKEISARQAKM